MSHDYSLVFSVSNAVRISERRVVLIGLIDDMPECQQTE